MLVSSFDLDELFELGREHARDGISPVKTQKLSGVKQGPMSPRATQAT